MIVFFILKRDSPYNVIYLSLMLCGRIFSKLFLGASFLDKNAVFPVGYFCRKNKRFPMVIFYFFNSCAIQDNSVPED